MIAKNNQAEQQCGSVTEIIQPRGVIMTLSLLHVINYFLGSFVSHILQCSLTCWISSLANPNLLEDNALLLWLNLHIKYCYIVFSHIFVY